MNQPFTLGVNYWPRRKAMYWWQNFDPGEVHEEFALLQELGLQAVRLFLLWDDFQPEPTSIDRQQLQHLEQVCDLAARHQLRLDVTFFTGHMSGPNWAPRWLLGGPRPPIVRQVISQGRITRRGYRNPFYDPTALQAELLLLKTVVSALKDHPAIWLWNLGNEPDLFAFPRSSAEGRLWVRQMTDLIHDLDPVHPVTCGLHSASLFLDNGLRVDQVFAETDLAVMHAYPMYTDLAVQPLDPDWVPFTCALTAALCGKPVLAEEFGGCTAPPGQPSQTWQWRSYGWPRRQFMANEEEFADFIQQTLENLWSVGATGALIWCFADYSRELWQKPPCRESRHERFFGLVRPDGTLKPHARRLQEFATRRLQVQPAPSWSKFNLEPEAFYRQPLEMLPQLYAQFRARNPDH